MSDKKIPPVSLKPIVTKRPSPPSDIKEPQAASDLQEPVQQTPEKPKERFEPLIAYGGGPITLFDLELPFIEEMAGPEKDKANRLEVKIPRIKEELELNMNAIGRLVEKCLFEYEELMAAKLGLYGWSLVYELSPEIDYEKAPRQTHDVYYGMLNKDNPTVNLQLRSITVGKGQQCLIKQRISPLEKSLTTLATEVREKIEKRIEDYKLIIKRKSPELDHINKQIQELGVEVLPVQAEQILNSFITETTRAVHCFETEVQNKKFEDISISSKEFEIFHKVFGTLATLLALIHPNDLGVNYHEHSNQLFKA